MEQIYSAPVDKVFGLLTDPQWLESRCLALGEISAKVRVKKSSKGVAVSMTRRVKRDLPALVARVLSPVADLQFEENWASTDSGGYTGKMTMEVAGQPVTMTADFSVERAGKGCIYRIVHVARCSIPLVGGTVAKFAQGQIEKGCADEFVYLVNYLKTKR
jgi:hypothetical protein